VKTAHYFFITICAASGSGGMEVKMINETNGMLKDLVEEKLPFYQVSILGLQHVLAMYAAAVSIPLIIGAALGLNQHQIAILIAADLFTCGIATLLQAVGIGNFIGIKLPVMLGCSFTVIAPIISIGKQYGLGAIYGACIAGGIFIFLFAPLFGRMLKLFPPVVTGSIVTVIGFSLVPIAINYAAGGYGAKDWGSPVHIMMASIVIITILVVNRFFKGFFQAISVLIAMIVGAVISGAMGMINLSEVGKASWFGFVQPFALATPTFEPFPIIIMCVVCLVNMIESTGVFFAMQDVCGKEITKDHIVKGLRAEGLGTILGGIFNSYPYATYSENVGLVSLTGVRSRFVLVAAGALLVLLGVLPKFSALATVIPTDVLGGAMVVMFAMVGIAGIRMLQNVDLHNNNGNLLTATCAIGIGLGVGIVPGLFDKAPEIIKILLGSNGIVITSIVAVLLNLLFNFKEILNINSSSDNNIEAL
jgi:xanthine permease